MSKHTPGPWKVGPIHPDNACISVTAENETEVAVLYGGDIETPIGDDGKWGSQPTRDANAYLIAAAPLLLEVLKSIHAIANTLDRSPSENNDAMWEIHQKARAAIAKAEGRT